MINSGNLDFSFSGLKTAVLYKLKTVDALLPQVKEEVARAFEDAAIEVLIAKTRQALLQYSDVRTLIVAGGVSGNAYLNKKLAELMAEFPEVKLRLPAKELTTDNAIMIGIAAFINIESGLSSRSDDIKAQGNLTI
jgi:N6-L-threonylcarbamoyladenine synthase